jgi:hypothetical protein
MALPKLVTPEFETMIPSTKKKIKFRPFLVKEEKILYMALEGEDEKGIEGAILSVLENCILTPDVDLTKLASYDVEYLFLKLRSKSVGEVVELNLQHGSDVDCNHVTKYNLSLEDVNVTFNDKHDYTLKIDEKYGVKMKDPSLVDIGDSDNIQKEDYDVILDLICNCVVCVYDEENVYDDFTKDEMKEFLTNLTQVQFLEIQKFFETMPKLLTTLEWTCQECGKDESVVLEGLKSFFM